MEYIQKKYNVYAYAWTMFINYKMRINWWTCRSIKSLFILMIQWRWILNEEVMTHFLTFRSMLRKFKECWGVYLIRICSCKKYKCMECNFILTGRPKYISNERSNDGTRTKRCIWKYQWNNYSFLSYIITYYIVNYRFKEIEFF